MSAPSKHWLHVTIGTYNSWPPGDPRGWRSHNHKKHSSGDHRNPPPKGEHAGYYDHAREHSGPPVRIAKVLRSVVGREMVEHFASLGHQLLALAVGAMHVHALVELPRDRKAAKHEVGRVKRKASCAGTEEMPGQIWARGCGLEVVVDRSHQRNAYVYVLRHREKGAWVWSYRAGERAFEEPLPLKKGKKR